MIITLFFGAAVAVGWNGSPVSDACLSDFNDENVKINVFAWLHESICMYVRLSHCHCMATLVWCVYMYVYTIASVVQLHTHTLYGQMNVNAP